MKRLAEIRSALRKLADPEKAEVLGRFFKTGPGEYGEGDRFLGITVPKIRGLVRESRGAPLGVARDLLHSPIHEERLLGLLLLVDRYRRGDGDDRERVYRLYVRSFPRINNWDLVDSSAEHIVGPHLLESGTARLRSWAASKNLWIRRIAIISTFHHIRQRRFDAPLEIAELLLRDPHDLIHKAVGWMLREIGKRDAGRLEGFLRRRYGTMPRTMLRYAIERFPEGRRRAYLEGRV